MADQSDKLGKSNKLDITDNMTHSSVPKYLVVKREILSRIHSGKLREGDQIAPELEIADQFQMSRQTVRQALGELEKDGWLVRVQGRGTYVKVPRHRAEREVKTIGMLTTYISDYIFPHIVRGAESALRKRGYQLLLSSTDNDKEKERESLELMLGKPLSGLIIEPTKSAQMNINLSYYLTLMSERIPIVMINERYPELTCPVIKVDDEHGGFVATDYLIRQGHRRIAGLFKTDDLQGVHRMKGFFRAHEEHRLAIRPEWVVHYATENKMNAPYDAMMNLFRRKDDRPTGIVCYNDELAVRALDAARRLGLRVPQDVSFIGFDDATIATMTEVKLTTIVHPKAQLGEAAADLLLQMIEGGQGETPADRLFKPELVVRESVSPI